jgi:predicted RecB family nuclease
MGDVSGTVVDVVITGQTLRNLLVCERRVWLDAHGDLSQRDETSPETLRLYALGKQHEQAIHAATVGPIEPIPIASWEEGVTITRDLMAQGVAGIIGACLSHSATLDLSDRVYSLRGKVDQLLRVWHHGEDVYAPIEIKQRSKPAEVDWLQLDFYVWLLSLIQNITPPAELWLGADAYGRPRTRLPHDYDEDRLMAALTRVTDLLNATSEPSVHLAPHCKTCSWYTSCQVIARREKRIDVLYGVSRTTRANMHEAGITNLEQVTALSAQDLQLVKGIGPKTAPRIRANARAWLDNTPVWYGALPEVCRQPGWLFDLETHEVSGKIVPWCMGWGDTQGNTNIVLVAPVQLPAPMTLPDGQVIALVPDSDTAWEVLAEAVSGNDSPIYTWTGYDVGILRGSAPDPVRTLLEPRFHDLHATFTQAVSLPLKSTSIKPVSAYLGFEWFGYNDWFAAYLDYGYWLEQSDLDALTRACTYQCADVQSLAHVWRWLVSNAATN